MGEVGRRTRIDGQHGLLQLGSGDFVAATLRGFLVYLAILAGLVIGNSAFAAHTRTEYVKLASLVSLAGFLAGFKPRLIRWLEEKVEWNIVSGQKEAQIEEKTSDGQVVAHAHLREVTDKKTEKPKLPAGDGDRGAANK